MYLRMVLRIWTSPSPWSLPVRPKCGSTTVTLKSSPSLFCKSVRAGRKGGGTTWVKNSSYSSSEETWLVLATSVLASIMATSRRGFSYSFCCISSSTSISIVPLILSKNAGPRAARRTSWSSSFPAEFSSSRASSATLFQRCTWASTEIPFKSYSSSGSAPSAKISYGEAASLRLRLND